MKLSQKQTLRIAEWRRADKTTHKKEWVITFSTGRKESAFIQPLHLGCSSTTNPEYYSDGSLRPDDHYIIFMYSLRGTIVHRRGSVQYLVPSGHGFLCEADNPDAAYYYQDGTSSSWTGLWLNFAGDSAFRLTRELINASGPVFEIPPGNSIIQQLLAFQRHDRKLAFPANQQIEVLIYELLVTLRHIRQERDAAEKGPLTRAALRVIETEYTSSTLSTTALASTLHVSREHLAREFQRRVGVPVANYIRNRRILLGGRLLRTLNLSLKEVAQRTGYGSIESFIRAFKRETGKTPAHYRDGL